jgi:hypothetical protein
VTEAGNFEGRTILHRPVRADLLRPPAIEDARRRLVRGPFGAPRSGPRRQGAHRVERAHGGRPRRSRAPPRVRPTGSTPLAAPASSCWHRCGRTAGRWRPLVAARRRRSP